MVHLYTEKFIEVNMFSHDLLWETFTALSWLCSFTRNCFVIFISLWCICFSFIRVSVCVCFSVLRLSKTRYFTETRKLSGLSRKHVMWHGTPGNVNLPLGAQSSARHHLWSEVNEVAFVLLYKKQGSHWQYETSQVIFVCLFDQIITCSHVPCYIAYCICNYFVISVI